MSKTAKQVIYASILNEAASADSSDQWGYQWPEGRITPADAERVWDAVVCATEYGADWLQDLTEETRQCGVVCNTGPDVRGPTRHYEVDQVCAELDGVWVGWLYWTGGGKHGEPESIEWIEGAVLLDVESTREVVLVVHTFSVQGVGRSDMRHAG